MDPQREPKWDPGEGPCQIPPIYGKLMFFSYFDKPVLVREREVRSRIELCKHVAAAEKPYIGNPLIFEGLARRCPFSVSALFRERIFRERLFP